ncbi:MAG: radical SAM domain-containing protein [Desulfofustis sp.]|nr:radical SAM domain-containing protein [Desulfofustis sp.]NNK13092.1 radical SAM domain-containing protein [Desulfofustis sp.]
MPESRQHGRCRALSPPRSQRCGAYHFELFKRGSRRYEKVSYPLRCGVYHEIDGPDAVLHLDLNHQPLRLIGKQKNWPHPQEWLKRTIGDDWIYYSTGGYTGVFETTGEFYLPNLPYVTNNHLGGKPLDQEPIRSQVECWPAVIDSIAASCRGCSDEINLLIDRIRQRTPVSLARRAKLLHRIVNGPVSVLPPDTRHVDYQVIPVNVSLGCLYKCSFCRVKNMSSFTQLTLAQIEAQLDSLQALLADDLVNFNAIFLGQHDGLSCTSSLLCAAVESAHRKLDLEASYLDGTNTFLFGSVGSLHAAEEKLFDDLDKLPGRVFINIGLESADQATLDLLGKPLRAEKVSAAFHLIQTINKRYRSIEITANFVTDPDLPESHYKTMMELIRDQVGTTRDKGCIYLSPLRFNDPSRARLFDFYKIKRLSRLPLYMYTIQRL